jgi:hypothetical protein
MIDQDEEIYLTKSDKLSDEANIESWFDPFDLRGILVIIAVIGSIGTMLAIYTITQSKKIKSLIASIFVSTHIPLVEAFPTERQEAHSHWEGIMLAGATQVVVILAAYVLFA